MAFGLTLRKEWKGDSEANETYRTVDVVVSKAFDVWSDGNVPDYSYNLSFCVGLGTLPPMRGMGKLQTLNASNCSKLASIPELDGLVVGGGLG